MKFFFLMFNCFYLLSCVTPDDRFRQIVSSESGLEFNNEITDTDSFNILTYEYIYNGGGVAVADFDNNGLPDIYFTGNMVSNALYLNRGELKFVDVTNTSGATGDARWSSGVAVADVNSDGWQDIYVCVTQNANPDKRRNLLYINQGLNVQGIPIFLEKANEYHVDDTSHTTNAAFLDYDNDGDLDLFLAINKMTNGKTANVYKNKENSVERIDRLFRNDWDSVANHPVFTNVSTQAGIIQDGYSLGINVTDVNQDGWADIFVTNDYLTNDLMYINQGNGTFTNRAPQYFKHTSHSAMGNDIIDINNDGLPDIITVDMLPEDNFRRKTMLSPNNYTTYINNEKYQYQYQYVRNTLQLNQGPTPRNSEPIFSDVSFLAGTSSTDWSWTPLVADFDNDGFRDIIITNGFPKDVTDRDFIDYYAQASNYVSKTTLLQAIPSVKIKNYAFRNMGGYIFENVTDSWGIKLPSFSNGASYGDFDADGDLDYVVNNINDKAFLFENLSNKIDKQKNNWLRINFKGPFGNTAGFGTKVKLYTGGKLIYADHSPFRGYLSTVEPGLHFGVGKSTSIDSIRVTWFNGSTNLLTQVGVNQTLTVEVGSSKEPKMGSKPQHTLFSEADSLFSGFKHNEDDYIDFNVQPMLLHKLSQYGPGLAVGDVDNNGLDDFYISAGHGKQGTFFIQEKPGTFIQKSLFNRVNSRRDELGVLLFDADKDGDLDLYSVSGGYEYPLEDSCYRHKFFENVMGKFKDRSEVLNGLSLSGSCVRATDFDRDGDLDLFIGGRVDPQQFPRPVSSNLLVNKSVKGHIQFADVSQKVAPGLAQLGLVCDALWTDFDQDGWVDLVLAGEWMSIKFLKNNKGFFADVTEATGLSKNIGWWNSITSADFDNDGDIDYVVGNLGINTLAKATDKEPVSIYASDFDKNGAYDMIPTIYFKNTEEVREEFPFFGRMDFQKELISAKRNYLKHSDFARAPITKILSSDHLKQALIYRANYFLTSYVENKGDGKFEMKALPIEVQWAPVYGMISDDINDDGNIDVIGIGNDFGTEVSMGRYDAMNGFVLLGNGKGNFSNLSMQKSGICVPGDGKSLVTLLNDAGDYFILAAQNRGSIKAFHQRISPARILDVGSDVSTILMTMVDGKTVRKEMYFGSGFLSQSSRKVRLPKGVEYVELITYSGTRGNRQVIK
jgi:enediyne biosynthesis protein E4